ncbi:hypothetical protein ACFE04_031398 [Oxalis oulophora]
MSLTPIGSIAFINVVRSGLSSFVFAPPFKAQYVLDLETYSPFTSGINSIKCSSSLTLASSGHCLLLLKDHTAGYPPQSLSSIYMSLHLDRCPHDRRPQIFACSKYCRKASDEASQLNQNN